MCQTSYLDGVATVLVFLEVPFASGIRFAVSILKYFFVGCVFMISIIIFLPPKLDNKFFDFLFQKYYRWDSILFYFIHSVVVIVLATAFVLSSKASSLFPVSTQKLMPPLIFIYAMSLALDILAFSISHTIHFDFKLKYTHRKSYLYLQNFCEFLYFDFPPLVMLVLVYSLYRPEEQSSNSIKIVVEGLTL